MTSAIDSVHRLDAHVDFGNDAFAFGAFRFWWLIKSVQAYNFPKAVSVVALHL